MVGEPLDKLVPPTGKGSTRAAEFCPHAAAITITSAALWYCRLMPDRSRKRPRDLNALAAQIVGEATGEALPEPESTKDPAAVSLGRRGGLKGGPARAAKLTPKRRSQIAKKAAQARWGENRG